jgi:hypothetical protein
MVTLKMIPLIGLIAGAYAVLAMTGVEVASAPLGALFLPSGGTWQFSIGDLLLVAGVVALYLEVLKATRTSQASVFDHILSLVVFVACLLGFLLVPALGTSVFLLLTIMAMFDVIAGFTVTISSARRDFSYSGDHPHH